MLYGWDLQTLAESSGPTPLWEPTSLPNLLLSHPQAPPAPSNHPKQPRKERVPSESIFRRLLVHFLTEGVLKGHCLHLPVGPTPDRGLRKSRQNSLPDLAAAERKRSLPGAELFPADLKKQESRPYSRLPLRAQSHPSHLLRVLSSPPVSTGPSTLFHLRLSCVY